jgi:hypothetical protein
VEAILNTTRTASKLDVADLRTKGTDPGRGQVKWFCGVECACQGAGRDSSNAWRCRAALKSLQCRCCPRVPHRAHVRAVQHNASVGVDDIHIVHPAVGSGPCGQSSSKGVSQGLHWSLPLARRAVIPSWQQCWLGPIAHGLHGLPCQSAAHPYSQKYTALKPSSRCMPRYGRSGNSRPMDWMPVC